MIDLPPPPVEIHESSIKHAFIKQPDLAQYKGSDYCGAIHVERGISLKDAFEIASQDERIDYFVFVKGACMAFEVPENVDFDPTADPLGLVSRTSYVTDDGELCEGYCRVFRQGDVVFFSNEGRWLGSAPGLADVYEKKISAFRW